MEHASNVDFDIVIGLDSRGFLLGPLISLELGKPFLPIRKKGKLPGHVLQLSYDLEYGQVCFFFFFFLLLCSSIAFQRRKFLSYVSLF